MSIKIGNRDYYYFFFAMSLSRVKCTAHKLFSSCCSLHEILLFLMIYVHCLHSNLTAENQCCHKEQSKLGSNWSALIKLNRMSMRYEISNFGIEHLSKSTIFYTQYNTHRVTLKMCRKMNKSFSLHFVYHTKFSLVRKRTCDFFMVVDSNLKWTVNKRNGQNKMSQQVINRTCL